MIPFFRKTHKKMADENNTIELFIEDFTPDLLIEFKKKSNTIIRKTITIEFPDECNGNLNASISYEYKRAN